MELHQLSGCTASACPKVFQDVDGGIVVQGVPTDGAPAGEARVEIPEDVLLAAADRIRALRRSA